MKQEFFLEKILRGGIEPITRDGNGYWVVVEPKPPASESSRLFAEVTFISGTAIAIKFNSHDTEIINNFLLETTFSKARARLALGLFDKGKEYRQEITSETLSQTIKPVEDEFVQKQLLTGLLNIRKSDPLNFKSREIDVNGFCSILAIPEKDFLFNTSLLIEDSLITPVNDDPSDLTRGKLFITSKGVKYLDSLKDRLQRTVKDNKYTNKTTTNITGQQYDVSLSFAGEDREIVAQLANALRSEGVKVFYDAFEEDTLWGKNLYEYLTRIYTEESKFTILFLSKHYANKAWTNHERQSAQARALRESREYILPIRLDDTQIPGISETIGYISLDKTTIDDIVILILRKLRML